MEKQTNSTENLQKQNIVEQENVMQEPKEQEVEMQENTEEILTEIKMHGDQKKKHVEKKEIILDEDSILYDIVQLIKENKAISGCIGAFIVFMIIGVVVMTRTNEADKYGQVVADAVVEDAVETEEVVEEVIVEPGADELVQNMYPELNSLMQRYYQALAAGDVATINQVKKFTSETDLIQIQKKSEYIQEYSALEVYSKAGPKEDSFIVFVTYEVKFIDFETTAPGLNTWYVCKDNFGNYQIIDNELEDDVVEFLNIISAQTEVIDLFNQVQVKYNEAKTADEELGTFLDNLPNLLAASVGEALAGLEEETDVEEETQEVVEEEPTTIVTKVRAIDVVNIRSSDSQEADKIGQAQIGDEFELVERKANGWAHIIFEDGDGYILGEYLEDSEVEEVGTTETEETNNDTESVEESEETNADTEPEEADASEVTSTITVNDTINIRKSASTTADKLGVVYPGEDLDILVEQADGWTKVSYNGRVGYVLSELLE